MLQLIITLNHLHSKAIIHRDITLGILLLGKNMELKIGDFGLAINVNKGKKTFGIAGTPGYQPPEMLNNEEYSFSADIWALGIIMCYLLTGENPFWENKEDFDKNIKNMVSKYLSFNGKISKAAEDLINQILKKKAWRKTNLKSNNLSWIF